MTSLHTPADLKRFTRDHVDPDTHQPREHAVTCQKCRTLTFNTNARCDTHTEPRP